jgi:hypothetical protein
MGGDTVHVLNLIPLKKAISRLTHVGPAHNLDSLVQTAADPTRHGSNSPHPAQNKGASASGFTEVSPFPVTLHAAQAVVVAVAEDSGVLQPRRMPPSASQSSGLAFTGRTASGRVGALFR